MYVTGRERKIMVRILHAQEAITVKEIADYLDVSERTIHRDLKNVEKIMSSYNLELKKKSGSGLHIHGDDTDKQKLELALSGTTPTDFTPDERKAIILSTLLEATEPIKLVALALELNVTIATISNDLNQLEKDLADAHLSIIRKRGSGVSIEGDEANKRAYLSKLITTYLDPYEYVSLLKDTIREQSTTKLNAISNRLLGLVNPETLNSIEESVKRVRDELPHDLADNSYIGLVVHLALAIERLSKGDTIKFDQTFMRKIAESEEYKISEKMIRELEKALSMDIPDDEIGYITMHLMGAKLRFDNRNDYIIEDSSLDIAFQTQELIQHVGSQLHVRLANDVSLLNGLVAHLKPTIYRLRQGMNINNPLIEEIKNDYSNLFHVIQKAVDRVFPDLTFPDDEIGYLCLHFASALLDEEEKADLRALIICSSGIGTAKILATKLALRFPEIKRVENKSLFDLKQIDSSDYDLVISTIPLTEFGGDYILTSPMLAKEEVNRIRKAIRQKRRADKKKQHQPEPAKEDQGFISKLERLQTYSKVILDIFASFSVKSITEKKSVASILGLACSDLAKKKLIHDPRNIVEKLVEREKKSGLGIPGSSIALYHTRSNDVEQPCFTIYRLEHPLPIEGMDGETMEMTSLILMLAPETAQQAALEVLSFLSSIIIQGQESINMFETGDQTVIKQFLSKQFQTFLHDKKLW